MKNMLRVAYYMWPDWPFDFAQDRPSFARWVRLTGWLLLALTVGLLVRGGLATYAQSGGAYILTWWTIDNGGSGGGIGTTKQLTGGPYELLSTVGQPEAYADINGGDYTLRSGFWPGERFVITGTEIYLPAVLKSPAPDLIGAFTLTPDKTSYNVSEPVLVTAVITNQGTVTATSFWVDFYINPSTIPGVNKRWNDLCSLDPCYGLAWYVSSLGAGQSVSLNSTPGNFSFDYSNWHGYFASGTTNLHLYVDSWNTGVFYGGVNESNEGNNLYTLPGGVIVTGMGANETSSSTGIPPRPARLED